jgi:ABC-type oligopeptide transport system substrate-binding subunit
MYKDLLLKKHLTIAVGVASLTALALAGCGGSGSNDNNSPATTNSLFAGTYVGTFNTTNPQSGTVNVTVGSNGTLTGSGHNSTTGQDETISGSVTNAGTLSITFTYPTLSASASGTVAVASNGHLDGTLTQSTGGSVTIDLVKQ